ncbi:DUF1684 domain-containing protein [Halobacteriaceae archaeon GCM10025711]
MTDEEFDEAAWRERFAEYRTEKDAFFADHPQSPVPEADRESFDGLDYFDLDPAWRVEATLRLHDSPRTVIMATLAGSEQEYRRVATLAFTVDGESVSLAGYQFDPGEEETLFVPFRDETTGEETYDNGRYLEVELPEDVEDGDTLALDFNRAYTPFCAFNDDFSCVIPPEENSIPVPVRAGERR